MVEPDKNVLMIYQLPVRLPFRISSSYYELGLPTQNLVEDNTALQAIKKPIHAIHVTPTPDEGGFFLQNLVEEKTIRCTFSSAAAAASKPGLFTQNLVENNTLSIKKGAHPYHL